MSQSQVMVRSCQIFSAVGPYTALCILYSCRLKETKTFSPPDVPSFLQRCCWELKREREHSHASPHLTPHHLLCCFPVVAKRSDQDDPTSVVAGPWAAQHRTTESASALCAEEARALSAPSNGEYGRDTKCISLHETTGWCVFSHVLTIC